MAAKKRQRKRDIYLCPNCQSPFSIAHTQTKFKPRPAAQAVANGSSPSTNFHARPIKLIGGISQMVSRSTPVPPATLPNDDYDYWVEIYCLSCKQKRTKSVTLHTINDGYEYLINQNYQKIKSPMEIELQFLSIKIDKKTMHKAPLGGNNVVNQYGMPAFFVFCKDRAGLMYRFSGVSAMKIIYETVKNRWFKTRICVQKFVRTGKNASPWSRPLGNEDAIQHWRQSPKIVGDIELL